MKRFALMLAMLLALAPAAHAWGPEGHMAVGAIADNRLANTPTAQKVRAILKPGESLQVVAVWADCVKGVRPVQGVLRYSGDDQRFPECARFAPETAQMERYVRANWTQCGHPIGNEYCHHQYHYADVPIQRNRYQYPTFAGTSDHDVVQAINATIAMLQDRPVPPPFVFADKREALMLLAHYVGDMHQPLHMGSIYIDTQNNILDPDMVYDGASENAGGNTLRDPTSAFHPGRGQPPFNLHSQWDAIPAGYGATGANFGQLLTMASQVPATQDEPRTWANQWAGESIVQARIVFAGLSYQWDRANKWWLVTGIDAAYKQRAENLQVEQLSKAGARLAALLEAVLK